MALHILFKQCQRILIDGRHFVAHFEISSPAVSLSARCLAAPLPGLPICEQPSPPWVCRMAGSSSCTFLEGCCTGLLC